MPLTIDKISRVVIQPVKNLVLKVHVKLTSEKDDVKENYYSIYNFNGGNYLKINVFPFLTLEITDNEWSKDKTIMITQSNLFQVVKSFKRLLSNIYNGNVFAINKQEEIVIYKDKVNEYTEKIFNLGFNQRMIISPAIVYDENDTSYEGVVLYMNITDNFITIPIDCFEALVYTLEKIDLFVYSQELLNFYMNLDNKQNVNQHVKYNNNNNDSNTKEFTSSKGIAKKKDIFGFKK